MKKTKLLIPSLAATTILAGAAVALPPILSISAQDTPPAVGQPASAEAAVPPRTGAIAEASRLGEAFSTVAESVSPAVVSIRVEAVQQHSQMQMPFGNGSPFGGMPFPFQIPNGGDEGVVRGGGSGVIVRPDGYILTNNHVVANARRIEVVRRNGQTYRARVVGSDPATDLAVIKIDATDLPVARLARSDEARVGEWVVAIGSPFGLDYTVTTGVLSAKGRGGLGANEIEDYLQTDASINPGNSGGPLVNLHGEVLGINTMIIGRGTGIGFAVPSDIARNVSEQIIESGRVRRAWLGVGFQELTPELAGHFGTQHRSGALVSSVVPRGPAARAGIRTGDVIVRVAGTDVREGRDLLRQVLRRRVGERVEVELLRNGRATRLTLTLAERPNEDEAAGDSPSQQSTEPQSRQSQGGDWGLELRPLTAELKQQLRYDGNGSVVVFGVRNGSPSERAGLKRGDVIVEADRQPVRDGAQVASALSDGSALLRVERGSGAAFFTVLTRD